MTWPHQSQPVGGWPDAARAMATITKELVTVAEKFRTILKTQVGTAQASLARGRAPA